MRRVLLLGFALLLLFDTSAQVCLKLAAQAAAPFVVDARWVARALRTPWLYAAIGSYIGAFFSWLGLLARAPVGPAFAASHLDVVSVLALSAILFREPLAMPQVIGSACIGCGILFLSASAADAEAGSR